MKNLLLATLIMIGFQTVNALEHVVLGQAVFAGTGCKSEETAPRVSISKGTVTISTLSILGNANIPSLILREACNIRIPAQVEQGYQLGIRVSEVSGSLSQTEGVRTTVAAAASLVGKNDDQKLQQEMSGKMKGKFRVSNKAASDEITWTSCGLATDSILALSASLTAIRDQTTTVVHNSVKQLSFKLSVRACPLAIQ